MDSHSRTVAYLKVLLPLAALALLSTLFLLSRSVDPTATIPFAEEDIRDRIGGQQVTAPFFSGTTSDGREIVIEAARARQADAAAPTSAEALRARITLKSGQQIRLSAATGTVSVATDTARFEGRVEITTTAGYRLLTERMDVALSGIAATSPGRVEGDGPIGRIEAGGMAMAAKTEGGPIHTLFNNGVKLVYDPKQPER